MKNYIIVFFIISIILCAYNSGIKGQQQVAVSCHNEPDVNLAKLWWPEQRGVWTPVGWKDHYFRFNVFYNGAIFADPSPDWAPNRPNSVKWLGQDFMIKLIPAPTLEVLPDKLTQQWRLDGGVGIQGWQTDMETPVLWTDFPLEEGLVIRQEIFAHVKGGKDVETGIEPLYAWIRLSVSRVNELKHPDQFTVSLQLSRVYYRKGGYYANDDGMTVDIDKNISSYPKALKGEIYKKNDLTGLHIIEPDGKVRLSVLPTSPNKVEFSQFQEGIYNLKVNMKAIEGDFVDLLLPMLPETMEEIEMERALSYEGALTQAESYWKKKPASAARVHVPEDHFNRWLSQSLKFAEIIAEKDYVTQDYTFLSGSWAYDKLWSTPSSMISHMFLNLMGYHDEVAKHIEVFRKCQGTVKPPGPLYDMHPGYFSSPKTVTSHDWVTDHGAILHQVSTHALLSNDSVFMENWTIPIVKACDFIKEMCSREDHNGVKGLLPAANANDDIFPEQATWNMAWNYKGLTTAVRFLKQINHSRAKEFEDFAAQFKKTFNDEYRKLSEEGERWTDSQGNKRYKPPTNMTLHSQHNNKGTDAFYLDTGPMILVWGGLMDANDPIMIDLVDFFRNGPNNFFYGVRHNALSPIRLDREISSCEPCYSWNVFHSWQLQDRAHFLEGFYSLLVGGTSQNTFISCEHRHGIQGNLFVTPLAFNMARLAVIDDQISQGELHLLRLCPLAWISSKEETVFEKMPTEYGNVNLRFSKSKDGKTLDVSFSGEWRDVSPRIILHIPPVYGLEKVKVNEKKYSVKKSTLEIS